MNADEVSGSGLLDFSVYATLQTSTSDLQHDSAFDADNDLSVVDGAAPVLRTSPQLPPGYPKSADCGSTVDEPLLPDPDETGSADPLWENFSDLEFPRDALSLIDTLGSSSFGEVRR